ncbi:retrovirus-related pol polyprotein from transposon TNT 1-94 [Tanacetum coccineum]
MATLAPQDRWSKDKHIELVNIVGNPEAGMLTREIAKELSAALAHECLFTDFLSEEEPKKVSEVLKHPGWVYSIQEELNEFARNKARLVAQDYRKEEGIDYNETFAPVATLEEIQIFLAFATYMNFTVYQMDVKSFESSEFLKHVYKLDKALYGLKQAPSACTKLCKQFAKLMNEKYKMSMMGVLTYFLRFQIKQSERGISINQENYVKDLLKKSEINGSLVKTPMVPTNNLGTRYQANPKESHLIIVKIIFRYLKATPNLGLWYPKCPGFDLKGYSDSNYVGCNMDRKSTSGACQLLGGKLVCWSAKKQQSVAMSSAEAEYVATARCCASILWMKSQFSEYDIVYEKVPIFCDSTSAIAISNNLVMHSRTKHIDIRYHFIRDHIIKGNIKLHFIPTQYQLVDIFTKCLEEPTFKRLIFELGMVNIDCSKSECLNDLSNEN